jgi:hypothetical protein
MAAKKSTGSRAESPRRLASAARDADRAANPSFKIPGVALWNKR